MIWPKLVCDLARLAELYQAALLNKIPYILFRSNDASEDWTPEKQGNWLIDVKSGEVHFDFPL